MSSSYADFLQQKLDRLQLQLESANARIAELEENYSKLCDYSESKSRLLDSYEDEIVNLRSQNLVLKMKLDYANKGKSK